MVNVLLLIFKFFAGFVGRSSAMVADAVHSLTDFVTDILVLVFVKISSKPTDRDHPYGHGKFETLASVVIAVMLGAVGIGIMIDSIKSITAVFTEGVLPDRPGTIALVAAALSILAKEILFRLTRKVAREEDSPATEANAWHHRSDALSSIGTFIGIGAALLLGDKWVICDPIAAFIVSVLIVKVSVTLMIPGLGDLLERSLPEELEQDILNIIGKYKDVSDPHHLRTRRIGPSYSVEVHIRVDSNMTVGDSHAITRSMEADIRERFGNDVYIIIHVEPKK
ncbi:MAG: cation transporter [Bacteroidales bacterium]|nr:cation transporter [Bacteroidales bacterium]